jgi:protein farnesyltransferase subunit beta
MEEGYEMIDRKSLYKWLLSLKNKNGGISLHLEGEIDVRGCYTLLSISSLTGILTKELRKGISKFIKKCQTYSGGISSSP